MKAGVRRFWWVMQHRRPSADGGVASGGREASRVDRTEDVMAEEKYPCPCGRAPFGQPIMVPCRCGANWCEACAHTKCHVDPPVAGTTIPNGGDWRGAAGGPF